MEQVLQFKGKWRTYQKRILDSLSLHFLDKRLHVVAAPGAGKTTLGIEIIARLNQPTVVLAPTLTIKNQWKTRIIESFLPENYNEDIISTDIKSPKFITIITYQALLSAFSNSKNDECTDNDYIDNEADKKEVTRTRFNRIKADKVIKMLKTSGIKVLCFDEAHHLRKEWWKALNYLSENLAPSHTVSLTATPPYDVDNAEWERYENLCGEIDELISIPELVKNGDLCPHQDFIHFSKLRYSEADVVNKQLNKINNFIKTIKSDSLLINSLADSVYMKNPEDNLEIILDNPEFFVSVASFLNSCGKNISADFLKIFDAKKEEIPPFNAKQIKYFLKGLFVSNKSNFPDIAIKIDELSLKAKNCGLLSKNTIYLSDSPKLKRIMAGSLGKLDSIKEIVRNESASLGEKLRMVILTDYIRLDDKANSKLGVIPIWNTLREEFKNKIFLGVLTGSLILIPAAVKDDFVKFLEADNLQENSVSMDNFDDDFIKITSGDILKSKIVNVVTKFFNSGKINVLVGTQALLGEGWDAPSINSLILASTVSSFMLSNQMRGRAIRIDKNNPNKVANIWHLASIKVSNLAEAIKEVLLPQATRDETEVCTEDLIDFEKLYSRFDGYEAPCIEPPYIIQSGLDRVLPEYFKKYSWTESSFMNLNRFMLQNAINRDKTRQMWEDGLIEQYNAPVKRLKTGVETQWRQSGFVYNSGMYAFWSLALCIASNILYFSSLLGYPVLIFAIIAVVAVMLRPFIMFLKCSTPEGIIRQIGIVILETLYAEDLIKTNIKLVKITVVNNKTNGYVYCAADNLSAEENKLFISSLREFLDPVENPRYILIRSNFLTGLFKQSDYHSVPAAIAKKKKSVEIFNHLWHKYIGSSRVYYTRTVSGRKLLLKARKSAFSSLVRPKSKKVNKWM